MNKKYYYLTIITVFLSLITISKARAETFTLQLQTGWNMISLPVNLTLTKDAISAKCSLVSSIYHYSPTTKNYEVVTSLTPGLGYWINVKSACTLTLTGNKVTLDSFPELKAGTNQIGSLYVPTDFSKIRGNCDILNGPVKYNPLTDQYEKVSTLEPGFGYFLKVGSNCKLVELTAATNLVAYYKLDEGTGSVAKDYSPNKNDATLYNNPTWVTGKFDKALQFNGANYVEAPDSTSLDLSSKLTLTAWINPSSTAAWKRIVVKSHTSNALPYVMYGLLFDDANHLRLEVGMGSLHPAVNGNTVIPLNTWTFVAGTYDGSTLKVYVNGNLDKSVPQTGAINTNNMPLSIARSGYGADYFQGTIDEVKIWNRALTADEIKSEYVFQTCTDGTLYGSCSVTQPKYCDNGTLINKCSLCGCLTGYTCQSDGSCQQEAITPGGLKGEYYDNIDFTALKLTRTDPTINFNWGGGSPDSSLGADTFSVRWQGYVKADYSQTYTFYVTTDDGSRVWIDNKLVIDSWTNQAPTERSGTISLTAGWHIIKYDYYEDQGQAVAQLSYSSPSVTKRIIPSDHLGVGGIVQKCSDGTLYGQCSSTKPKYCDTGNLINRCSLCGCPTGYTCQSDESCLSPCTNIGLGTPSLNPSTPAANQPFQILCPATQSGVDCISAYANSSSNQCTFSQWSGSNAIFNCSGLAAGTYTARCISSTGTSRNCCSDAKTTTYTITAPSDLVAYYKLDENTGTKAYDSSPNKNDGTLYNGPVWATGKSGKALQFDGVNDYVEAPDSTSLDLSSKLTLTAWINPSSITAWKRIVVKSHTSNALPYVMYGLLFDDANHLRLEVGMGSLHPAVNGNTVIPLNTWTFVAGTYDGSTLKVYVNGNLDKSVPQTGAINTNNMPLSIARSGYGADYFQGTIDEVKIWNRALTQAEIQAEYGVSPCTNIGLGTPSINPSTPAANQPFQILCPATQAGVDCISAYANSSSNQCTFSQWSGSNAIFNCSGLAAGTYTARCVSSIGTSRNCCSDAKTSTYIITSAPTCSSLNYPSDKWQRVWYTHSTGACLGNGPDQTSQTFDNDWSTGIVAYSKSDDIEFRSSRTINFPTAGNYTFTFGSDDGARLWIDDSLKIDKWIDRAYTTDSITLNLTAGNHKLRIDYYENGGNARASLSYTQTTLTCSDGTPYGQCSTNKPKYCDNGNLINKCTTCGCPVDQECNTTTEVCYTPDKPGTCSDGTPYGQCSINKPLYCSSGTLINACGSPYNCGCPSDSTCQADQSCLSTLTETSYIIFKDGSTIKAKNSLTNNIDWSSSSFGTVLQSVVNSIISKGGGRIYVKSSDYTLDKDIILDDPSRSVVAGEGNVIIFDFGASFITFNKSIRITNKPARIQVLNLQATIVYSPIIYARGGTREYSLYQSLFRSINILNNGPHTAPAFDLGDITECKFEVINAQQTSSYPIFKIGTYKAGNRGGNLFQRVMVRREGTYESFQIVDGGYDTINNVFLQCNIHEDTRFSALMWNVKRTIGNTWYSSDGNMRFENGKEDSMYDHQGGDVTLISGSLWADGGHFWNIRVNGGDLYLNDIESYDSLNNVGGTVHRNEDSALGKLFKGIGTLMVEMYKTGTVSYSGSSKSLTISHGLPTIPKVVTVTPLQNGQGKVWVTNESLNTFTINFDNAPGASTWRFDWYASGLTQTPSPIVEAEADYIIYNDAGTIKAKNGLTGSIDFTGTFGSVLQSAVNRLITNHGGKIYVKKGDYTLGNDIIIDDPGHDYVMTEGGIIIFDFGGSSVTFDGSIRITNKPARIQVLNLVSANIRKPIIYSRAGPGKNYGMYRSSISNVNILGGDNRAPAFDLGDITECKFELINAQQATNYPIFLIGVYKGQEGVNIFERVLVRRTGSFSQSPYKQVIGGGGYANIQNVFVHCTVRDDGSYTNPAWDTTNTFRNAWYSCNGDMYVRAANEDTIYDNQGGSLTLDSGGLWIDGGYFNNIRVNGGSLYMSDVKSYNSLSGSVSRSPNNYSGKYLKNSATASYSGSSKSFTVNHGLVITPKVVIVSPQQTGQGNIWVTNKGSTTFTINFDTAPGSSTWKFDWYAE